MLPKLLKILYALFKLIILTKEIMVYLITKVLPSIVKLEYLYFAGVLYLWIAEDLIYRFKERINQLF
jgi:hypothetical protein